MNDKSTLLWIGIAIFNFTQGPDTKHFNKLNKHHKFNHISKTRENSFLNS